MVPVEEDPSPRLARAVAVVEEKGILNTAGKAKAIRREVRERWSPELAACAEALWRGKSVEQRERAVLEAGRCLMDAAVENDIEGHKSGSAFLDKLDAQITAQQVGLLTSKLLEEAGHGSASFPCDLVSVIARGTENVREQALASVAFQQVATGSDGDGLGSCGGSESTGAEDSACDG